MIWKNADLLSLVTSQSPLPLAQLCMEYEYLVNAILGFAWAVAVVMGRGYHH
jgi:hypothetical protein